ncbi:MAG: hypothetical protein K9M36_03175 [Candidatus Pacebacteria bacterium]|nr:hypothetical protein [Candidatus Paceibacterota bacterium]
MSSWFSKIRNKPPHERQKAVFWIALGLTICIFLVWGIAKFRILNHKVEESRVKNVDKPASPFEVFGKSLKNVFTDIEMPTEENFMVDTTAAGDTQIEDTVDESEMQMYFGEDFESTYDISPESSDTPEDSMDFYGENQ